MGQIRAVENATSVCYPVNIKAVFVQTFRFILQPPVASFGLI